MPPKLALIICICFIIAILILDKKYKEDMSWALWLPVFWLLIRASRPLVLWLNPGTIDATSIDIGNEGSPIDRNFLLLLLTAGIYVLFKRRIRLASLIKDNFIIFLFFFYCALSIAWSDAPRATFNAWVKMFILLVMSLIIVTDNKPYDAFVWVLKRTFFILLPLSIILIKYFPEYGRTYSRFTGDVFFGGVSVFKTGMGTLCLFAILTLAWNILHIFTTPEKKSSAIPTIISFIFLGIATWLLMLSDTKSSLVATFFGIAILASLYIPRIKSWVNHINLIAVVFVVVSLLLFTSQHLLEGIIHGLGRDMTLTGRTLIWERVLNVDINPLLGTGYGSFWHGARANSLVDINFIPLTQAHNGFIEAYLNLGWLGLTLLTFLIISAFNKVKYSLRSDMNYGILQLAFFSAILLNNITEATLAITSSLWFIFITISLRYDVNAYFETNVQ